MRDHATGGYASLTPGYYLKTRSGLIKWSRACTALHWTEKIPGGWTVGGFCFWLALLAGARLRHGILAGGLRSFQLKKTQDSDLFNWGEGYTEPVVAVPVARVVAAPVR
jgi:hypothetical protein